MAECCKKFYTCRLCHNENENHEIDRYKIKTVKCLKCGEVQSISNKCTNCHIQFARYYCDYCHFYNDDPNINIFVYI